MSSRPDRYPLFSANGQKVSRWVTHEQGEALHKKDKAIRRCTDCKRNLQKANCRGVFGQQHNLEYQLKDADGARLETSPNCPTDWDMEIYATGCVKMKAEHTKQIQADRATIEQVRAKVDAFAHQWRA